MDRATLLFEYPLYSIKRLPTFCKYSFNTAKQIARENSILGGSTRVFFDMLWCNLRYGAMDSRDYRLFEFYKKNSFERNQFFTKRRYFRLIKTFDRETFSKLLDKDYVNEHYSEFINREWIKVTDGTDNDSIRKFLFETRKAIVKPLSSEQGKGIFKITSEQNDKIEKFIKERKGVFLIEECLENHPTINTINPSSLNTMRVYTMVDKDGNIHILNSFLRVGGAGSDVDNWGSGGIGYHVNKDGIVDGYGIDKKCGKHAYHPSTNIMMIGFKIPRYNELVKFCKDIIKKNKKAVYCGLDIAITEKGFALVEINFPGGHDFLQCQGKGFYPTIKKYRGL